VHDIPRILLQGLYEDDCHDRIGNHEGQDKVSVYINKLSMITKIIAFLLILPYFLDHKMHQDAGISVALKVLLMHLHTIKHRGILYNIFQGEKVSYCQKIKYIKAWK
jgi:hypothetical protein